VREEQSGAISGQVRQAEAGQKAALFSYEAAIQNAFSDVEKALASRKKLLEQIIAQERLVRAASEYVRLAMLQYNGGYSPYSTVLQAEQQLFPAELNYAQYRASLFTSVVYRQGRGRRLNGQGRPDDQGRRLTVTIAFWSTLSRPEGLWSLLQ
jgi:hypothetical protein